MRLEMLDKLQEGHQGVVKCRLRAKSLVWCPELSKQLENLVMNYTACAREWHIHAEPMMPSESRLRPQKKAATGMFLYRRSTYLLALEFYVEIAKLDTVASSGVINHLKSIFAKMGSQRQLFWTMVHSTHFTTSSRYAQSNGKAEQAAQTVTNLLKKSVDPYNALLSYHSTPPEYGYYNYRYFSVFLTSRIPTISQFVELYIRVLSFF